MPSKMINVTITVEEYNQLKSFCSHHGDLSHILRGLIRNFIDSKKKTGKPLRPIIKGEGDDK